MTTAFYLNNKEAKRKLKEEINGKPLPFGPELTSLEVTLDKLLTLRCHLQLLRKKLSREALSRQLPRTSSGGGAILRTTALFLVLSVAKFRAPIWCRGAYTHLIDVQINNALRIVTKCLRSVPVVYPPVLAGSQPPWLHCKIVTLQLSCRAKDPGQSSDVVKTATSKTIQSRPKPLRNQYHF